MTEEKKVVLHDDEAIVKKAVLSEEEVEWFEKYKGLPFFDGDSDDHFSQKVFDKMMEYRENFEDWEDYKNWEKPNAFINRLSQAYFMGYVVKEKKYYIKLPLGESKYLREDRITGTWYFGLKVPSDLSRSQFTQAEIDSMQTDQRAKGLDLNVLKVEVPEDELED